MRRRRARHDGSRCAMCGTVVQLDDNGRCALGHQVVMVEEDVEDVIDLAATAHDDAEIDVAQAAEPPRERTPALVGAPRTKAGMLVFEPAPAPPRVIVMDPDDPRATRPARADGHADLTVDDIAFSDGALDDPPQPSAFDLEELPSADRAAATTPAFASSFDALALEDLEAVEAEERGRIARLLGGTVFLAALIGLAFWLAVSI